LPQIFDVTGIPTYQQRFEVFIHERFNRQRALLKGGTTVSYQPLPGSYPNSHQVMSVRPGNKTLDIIDNHRRHEKLLCCAVEIRNRNIIALKMFTGKPFFLLFILVSYLNVF